MEKILIRHRKIWKKKPLLRLIYRDWYWKIARDFVLGKTVELGSGSGNFKEYMPRVISSDIDYSPWLDMVFDAHKMPFRKENISNLIMVDVLHHLADPVKFLEEAARVLRRGGRLIMLEPYPSPVSLVVYRLFHPEPFDFTANYFERRKKDLKKHWDSNQAIPFLIFFRNLTIFNKIFRSKFRMIKRETLSYLTYPLSGGFENKQLYPTWFKQTLDVIEVFLTPVSKLFAFRCYVVLEKL